jgi:hypothetical protein
VLRALCIFWEFCVTEQEIKEQFKIVNRNSILIRVIGGILLLPLTIVFFSGTDSFIGISRANANLLFMVAMIANVVYLTKFWKCPACGKKLGAGLNVKKCESCNVQLK